MDAKIIPDVKYFDGSYYHRAYRVEEDGRKYSIFCRELDDENSYSTSMTVAGMAYETSATEDWGEFYAAGWSRYECRQGFRDSWNLPLKILLNPGAEDDEIVSAWVDYTGQLAANHDGIFIEYTAPDGMDIVEVSTLAEAHAVLAERGLTL